MLKKCALLLAMIFGMVGQSQNQWTEIHQVWENSQWKNFKRYTPTYDANQSAIQESLTESWNDQTQAWQNQYRVENTIPFLNLITQSLTLEWNAATAQWVNDKLQIRDIAYPMDQTTQDWDGAAWQNETRLTAEEFIPNESYIYVYQVWSAGQWENDLRTNYTFSEPNSELIEQDWQNGAWVNQTRIVAEGNISTTYLWSNGLWEFSKRTTNQGGNNFLTETFNAVSQTWLPESQQIATIESVDTPEFTGDLETTTTQLYLNGAWANSYRITRFAGPFLSNPETEEPTAAVYPNPATQTLYLQSYSGDFTIFTVDGRQVSHATAIEPQTAIDVSGLPSGVYILKTSGQPFRFVKQ